MKNIENKHVVIICTGSSLKTYYDEIVNFISSDKDIVVIGVNNIEGLIPIDYQIWFDDKGYRTYSDSKFIDEKTFLILSPRVLERCDVKKDWGDRYILFNIQRNKRLYEINDIEEFLSKSVKHFEIKEDYVKGPFETAGSLAIVWAYMKGASIISVVGMDGYTYYTKEELESTDGDHHFFEKGYSGSGDYKNFKKEMTNHKINNNNYDYCEMVDSKVIRTLLLLKKYGIKFNIITPTVFKEFFNKRILNINE